MIRYVLLAVLVYLACTVDVDWDNNTSRNTTNVHGISEQW